MLALSACGPGYGDPTWDDEATTTGMGDESSSSGYGESGDSSDSDESGGWPDVGWCPIWREGDPVRPCHWHQDDWDQSCDLPGVYEDPRYQDAQDVAALAEQCPPCPGYNPGERGVRACYEDGLCGCAVVYRDGDTAAGHICEWGAGMPTRTVDNSSTWGHEPYCADTWPVDPWVLAEDGAPWPSPGRICQSDADCDVVDLDWSCLIYDSNDTWENWGVCAPPWYDAP